MPDDKELGHGFLDLGPAMMPVEVTLSKDQYEALMGLLTRILKRLEWIHSELIKGAPSGAPAVMKIDTGGKI